MRTSHLSAGGTECMDFVPDPRRVLSSQQVGMAMVFPKQSFHPYPHPKDRVNF